MRPLLGVRPVLAAALLIAACAPAPVKSGATEQPTAASPTPELSTPAYGKPEFGSTDLTTPPPAKPMRPVEPPAVTLADDPFPTSPPVRLVATAPTAEDTAGARLAVQHYLQSLDSYRKDPRPDAYVMPFGRFRDIVLAAVKVNARLGVIREFSIADLRVERVWMKPWGQASTAEVAVTIVDRVVSGGASEESEQGRLRLRGTGRGRYHVIDGWDATAARWFNDPPVFDPALARSEISRLIGWYLQQESWTPDSPPQSYWSVEVPFWKLRNAQLAAFDRSRILARSFESVAARIERFEPFSEFQDGIFVVRVSGTLRTSDNSGPRSAPFERRVRVLSGNNGWSIIDEQAAEGSWLSGGELGLRELDQSMA